MSTERRRWVLTYTLIGQSPVLEPDTLKWAEWFGNSLEERIVARTEIDASLVSTVFLGLDHRFGDEGPPLLFETMIFTDGDAKGVWRRRCSTWLEAEGQHAETLRMLARKGTKCLD